jgi:hypothetical protein
VSTHLRRKRIRKVVTTLVALHGVCKSSSSCSVRSPIPLTLDLNDRTCFRGLATGDVHPRHGHVPLRNFPLSLTAHPRLGMSNGRSTCRIVVAFITYLRDFSWYLNLLSWVLAMAASVIIVSTGAAANRGERWAAGNRVSYGAIPG